MQIAQWFVDQFGLAGSAILLLLLVALVCFLYRWMEERPKLAGCILALLIVILVCAFGWAILRNLSAADRLERRHEGAHISAAAPPGPAVFSLYRLLLKKSSSGD